MTTFASGIPIYSKQILCFALYHFLSYPQVSSLSVGEHTMIMAPADSPYIPPRNSVRVKRDTLKDSNKIDLSAVPLNLALSSAGGPDQWDPSGPVNFNTDDWHVKQWSKSDLAHRNIMREAFRSYFTSRNSYIVRKMVFDKLYLTDDKEKRDECNPFFSGVDFCGSHGDCVDLTIGLDTAPDDENPFFECQCYEGWTGLLCERDIDECKQSVCQNSAFCEDLLPPRMFKCTCKPYTYGRVCDKEYPKNEEGFQCQSTDKSSLISWVPEQNFRILDYFPHGLRNLKAMSPQVFRKFVSLKLKLERGMDIGIMAKSWLKNHATHVYLDHEKDPTIVENLRPPHYIRYYNDWGFNFNWIQTHSETDSPFQHVIEIVFPAPVLIRGFVVRGGYEKRNVPKDCIHCKRLVTKYKVTVRRGSSKWFRLRNIDSTEITFDTLSPSEKLVTTDDLKRLDIDRPRYQALTPPVTAEAVRVHVIDWWPRNLDLSSFSVTTANPSANLPLGLKRPQEPTPISATLEPDDPPPQLIDVKNIGRERIIRSQNPVLRFDVMGCHGMIV